MSRSVEWLDQQYRSIFDRPVDPSGATTWTRAVRSGSTLTQISVQLLASPEFFAGAGGTSRGFVADLYRVLRPVPTRLTG